MLVACWSTKGGSGTTTVAAALTLLARSPGALAVDLGGDLPVALGLAGGDGTTGVADWLAAAPDVPVDGLARLEEPVTDGVALVRRGSGPLEPRTGGLLAGLLAEDRRTVVADCGRIDQPGAAAAVAVAAAASPSILVLRPCYLALRRAIAAPVRPTGIVVVHDRGRAIEVRDIESSCGSPVIATVRATDQVARAVDAGLLTNRLPRTLAEDLRHVA